jgi:hypothetical protein
LVCAEETPSIIHQPFPSLVFLRSLLVFLSLENVWLIQ